MDSHSDRFTDVVSDKIGSQGLTSNIDHPTSASPEMEVWEPPFERWLKLADDLLRDWSCEVRAARH